MSKPQQPISVAAVAVDVVIFTIKDGHLSTLLIQAKTSPFPGKWVLPGGLVKPSETIDEAVKRHMSAKVGIQNVYFEQLYTFGEVDRDPRGRVVSVAYMVLLPYQSVEPKTNDAYTAIKWFPASLLPRLGYDHREIINVATNRLKAKLGYTNIVYGLLSSEFTLSQMQKIYEGILSKTLDKRNFRKKILQTKLLQKVLKKTIGDAHRPAQLYRFKSRKPQIIEIL